MAGDWIPMRLDLSDDPAVLAVCGRTGLDEFGVIGRLHKLWCWANRHLKDGHAAGVTATWVDQYVGRKGFAAALAAAGWLSVTDSGVTFPKFETWNSNGAKSRLTATKRQQRKRIAGSVTETGNQSRQRHGQGVTAVTVMSRPACDEIVTREEERREERNPPLPPRGGEGELIHELAEQTGIDPSLPANRVKFARTAASLAGAIPPYTAADVREFGRRWREFCTYTAAKTAARPSLPDFEKRIGGIRSGQNVKAKPKRMMTREMAIHLLQNNRPVSADVLAHYGLAEGAA